MPLKPKDIVRTATDSRFGEEKQKIESNQDVGDLYNKK